jgi:hypothetical protein
MLHFLNPVDRGARIHLGICWPASGNKGIVPQHILKHGITYFTFILLYVLIRTSKNNINAEYVETCTAVSIRYYSSMCDMQHNTLVQQPAYMLESPNMLVQQPAYMLESPLHAGTAFGGSQWKESCTEIRNEMLTCMAVSDSSYNNNWTQAAPVPTQTHMAAFLKWLTVCLL